MTDSFQNAETYREKVRKLKSFKGVCRFRTHEEADIWMKEWKRRLDQQEKRKTEKLGEEPLEC
jgi:hypothetical protein